MNRIIGIICEYNPFHYGHLYQIKAVKESGDTVVCIMSGNLVQRGEPAVCDKYVRAKAAVMCGADLVVELPFPYSALSAKDFAAAGVYIANSLCLDYLSFGCEDSLDKLIDTSLYILTDEYKSKLEQLTASCRNMSFPVLRQRAVFESLGAEYAALLSKPNNILAIEYLKSINANGYKIKPLPVSRNEEYMSSSEIRRSCEYTELLPEESAAVFNTAPIFDKSAYQKAVLAYLRRMTSADDSYYEINGGFGARILAASMRAGNLEEVYNYTMTSTYTKSKIRRAVLSLFFDIKKTDAHKTPSYTSVLCANENGREYLADIRKRAFMPVVTKPASAKNTPYESEFVKAARADAVLSVFGGNAYNPYRKTPVMI